MLQQHPDRPGFPAFWDTPPPDPGSVFRKGVADLVGVSIPVRAGRYHVTFNSRTFEYSFEKVDHGD